ncbi:MAG: putative DNA-binding domain-containing protein [Hyphomicrobiaceae bacterium]|nr:putative DNA-binding domain-containing protein [Hyphomicrobiaceae bacterium]
MTSLKDLQARFQAGIVGGDDAVLSDINDSSREERRVLFGVYRNAYVLRLAEILGHDYELTHTYLGDKAFSDLAHAYIAAHPSDKRNARWFGRHLPDFARKTAPFSKHTEIGELAGLEKALADAFDGPDARPVTIGELAAIPPEDWANLVFIPHPTAVRTRFKTNAADIWMALNDGTAPPGPTLLPEPQIILVWRQDLTARFRPLAPEEAMMWAEAAKGVRFGILCEMVATFGGEDGAELRAATYLKTWLDTGLLACVSPDCAQSDLVMGTAH